MVYILFWRLVYEVFYNLVYIDCFVYQLESQFAEQYVHLFVDGVYTQTHWWHATMANKMAHKSVDILVHRRVSRVMYKQIYIDKFA